MRLRSRIMMMRSWTMRCLIAKDQCCLGLLSSRDRLATYGDRNPIFDSTGLSNPPDPSQCPKSRGHIVINQCPIASYQPKNQAVFDVLFSGTAENGACDLRKPSVLERSDFVISDTIALASWPHSYDKCWAPQYLLHFITPGEPCGYSSAAYSTVDPLLTHLGGC